MKKQTIRKPTRSRFTLLRQLCNLISPHLVSQLARDTGVADQTRTFTPWSHVVSLIYAHLTHAFGLNVVCDDRRLHAGPLSALRAAAPPSKNAPQGWGTTLKVMHLFRQRSLVPGHAA